MKMAPTSANENPPIGLPSLLFLNRSGKLNAAVIGLDIGGTFIRAGLFNTAGKLLAARQTPIEAQEGAQVGLERIAGLVRELVKESGNLSLIGIGLGATGPVDPSQGILRNPYTLPGWEDIPIVSLLREIFGVPVSLENDADMAALGEYWQGAGKGIQRLAAVTVGTGIGTALILEGKIYRGLEGSHPEVGHQVIDPSGPLCYCGARGCWEVLASGLAIARQAGELIGEYPASILLKKIGGNPDLIDARMVAEAALEHDPLAERVFEQAARYFSLGLVNLILFYLPDVIVLSGGVMKSFALFKPTIEKTIVQHNIMAPLDQVRIIPAALGYYAGLYGAAYNILYELEQDIDCLQA